ncbi:ankyrin repeat domain-containing protein 60 isoform X2 [Meleagris gallopavo]|uniref:ankyrin repeat domain-containing protein 60 isoform X2 n=1 Tax=Meleagris gallopavo TaxID=9103 RepID=UPI000939C819|nr:ankyrin repeat domain-containing protein 60 isoform X2 [Meleagris gallopavo]
MLRSSSPLQTFSFQLRLAETNEIFSLPQCQNDLTLKQLKSDLELLTGIPFHFQRLHYLDENLPDDSTLMDNDIVPGGTITMRVWRQDGWGHLVAAAAKGDTMKVDSIASVNGWGAVCRNAGSVLLKTFECFYQLAQLGVTEEYAGTSPYAKILGPEQKKEWVAHRAFVALFVASHRGRVNTVKFLLSNGADVHSKTPLGRTALHVAAVMGRCECIELLLSCGARALDPDCEGQTSVKLAQRWGQKQSERVLMRVPRQPAGARP